MSVVDAHQHSYRVRITFRGLCPFVPGSDDPRPGWVGAFLINASAASRSEFKIESPELFPEHFPFLEYRVSDLVSMESAPKQTVLSPLRMMDMVFALPPESDKELLVDLSDHDLGEVPGENEGNFFDWVTPMNGVTPGSGDVASECFDDDPSRRLIARVHITSGLLQTERLAQFKKQAVVAPLQLDGVSRRRAVAKSVSLTMNCGPGEFKIRMRPFGEPGIKSEELIFRQPSEGEFLKIGISNLCADDLLLAASRSVTEEEARQEDLDFRWNYLISTNVYELLEKGGVPGPFEVMAFPGITSAPNDGGGGVDGAQCSPPKSASVSDQSLLELMQGLAAQI